MPINKSCTQCHDCGFNLPQHDRNCAFNKAQLLARLKDPFIGTVLVGRKSYQLLFEIGRGGVSVVYKARVLPADELVAIKILKDDLGFEHDAHIRFAREANAVQRLGHPHVINMHETGMAPNGQPFLVMDYIEGTLLADLIAKEGRLSVKRAFSIFGQLCDALEHAHKHNVIHRDLKPHNIMLVETEGQSDFVKIIDFGFAKLIPRTGQQFNNVTQPGDIFGTPLYMSPEQAMGKTIDRRADIYSLGCVMYEALIGRAPLVGRNDLDTLQKQINEIPATLVKARPDLAIPKELAGIISRMLQKEPEDRYQSIEDVRRDLNLLRSEISGESITERARLLFGLAKLKQRAAPSFFVRHAARISLTLIVLTLCWCFFRPDKHVVMPDDYLINSYINQAQHNLQIEQYPKAKICTDRALALAQKMGKMNNKLLIDVLRTSAVTAAANQNFPDAEMYLHRALAVGQRDTGDASVTLYFDLARIYDLDGNPGQANMCYRIALRQAHLIKLNDRKLLANLYNNYALFLKRTNNTKEAQKFLVKAMVNQM